MNKIVLKKNFNNRIKSGHHWIFSNELVEIPAYEPSFVKVVDYFGNDYGIAVFNRKSLISARLLFTNDEINLEFVRNRISKAVELRKQMLPNEECVRIVFGESDLLPGVVIDKYGDYFSIQILSAGMELLIDFIIASLIEIFPNSKGIIQKNNNSYRELEGLSQVDKILFGEIPERFNVEELSIKLSISLIDGQKTGYFLDQKLNRFKVREFAKDKNVLDCFCNQGGFALNAANGGAKNVLGLDISKSAIDNARINAELNNLNNCSFEVADVFDYLHKAVTSEKKWDMIILDPPSFTKSRKTLPTALKGYSKLNNLALNCLNDGGILVSSSCTQLVDELMFKDLISATASKKRKLLKILYRGLQSPDHPIITSMKETEYLKFFVFKVETY